MDQVDQRPQLSETPSEMESVFSPDLKIEVPGTGDAEVVVAVVVPVVVDVEAAGIEIADVDAIAIRIHCLPALFRATGTRGLPPARDYVLSFLYFIREQPSDKPGTSPPRTGKKFCLCLLPRAAAIRRRRHSGDVSKTSCPRGEAVAAPSLADILILAGEKRK